METICKKCKHLFEKVFSTNWNKIEQKESKCLVNDDNVSGKIVKECNKFEKE